MIAGVAALAALAAARPPSEVPRMELAAVLGRTVCPLRVLLDEDPLRLPRRIKFLTCERSAARRCPAAPAAACCRWRDHNAQCVEVFDNVVVQYLAHAAADPRNATHHVVQVPVGCSCVLTPGTPAAEDD